MLDKQSKCRKHLPAQMGYNENHRIRCICVRIIHVNAVRACRPVNTLTVLHGHPCRGGGDWCKDLPKDPTNQGAPNGFILCMLRRHTWIHR